MADGTVGGVRLWGRYVGILLRGQMQYRASSVLLFLGQFLGTLTGYLGIRLMFLRFEHLAGWTLHEVTLFYAMAMLAFSVAEMAGRGFDLFARLVRYGDLDRLLLRPRALELQVMGSQFEWTRAGRLLQGLAVLVLSVWHLDIPWTAGRILALLLTLTGGIAVYLGIFILTATLCFWTIQGLELANLLTDGGRQMSQYPMTIYRDGFRRVFTWVIPLGLTNYIPLRYVLGHTADAVPALLAPAAATLFVLPCLFVFRLGVRHYKSTGS